MKTAKLSNSHKNHKRSAQEFPPGWNERKVTAVIKHYEKLTDNELAREIESAPEVAGETLVSVPTALLPAVKKLISKYRKGA